MSSRYQDRRADGTKDRAVHLPFDPEKNDEVAELAERFFGDRYGLMVNEERVPDDGDFVVWKVRPQPRRFVIDVKWTPLMSGRLVTFIDQRVKADIYVLVVGYPGAFRIAGWTPGSEHRSRNGDLGHGPRNVSSQGDLRHDIDGLMTWLGHPPIGGHG